MNSTPTHDYTIDDLLGLLITEKAKGLSLCAGRPPVVSMRGEDCVIEGPDISFENSEELLRDLATTRQLRELRRLGSVEFLFAFHQRVQFKVLVQSDGDSVQINVERVTGEYL